MASGFSKIAQELGLEDPGRNSDPVATREIVKGCMSNPFSQTPDDFNSPVRETSWLLIFNNADDHELLEDYWPVTGVGAVLATSRNPVAKEGVYRPAGIDPPLPISDASRLLLKLSAREKESNRLKLCKRFVHALSGLPFAFVQMGAIIRRRQLSLKDFLAYYEQDAKRLQETIIPGLTYNCCISMGS